MNGSIRPPIHSLADIKKTDLMQECRQRGLKCGGDKTTIMMRLEGLKDVRNALTLSIRVLSPCSDANIVRRGSGSSIKEENRFICKGINKY